ncbi:CAAX prenyl protease 2 isoform X2 [Cryptomeria japonica]|uniref:CAAX prenyl protease 2 isoform X2 n=1 Tax=Cryptomeria japonica TaxID=3369 RepID=UPI0025ABFE16|nr:CAAX prenyl protease 2 isoform X2 [Cryptomeria japonica]
MEADSSVGVSKILAVAACTGMSLTYVGLLYAPRYILRLPPPVSFNEYMLRRFSSVAVSSIISLFMATLLLLPVWDSGKTHITSFLSAYGLKTDHLWQAVFFPLILTALLYLGPLMTAAVDVIGKQKQEQLLCAHGALGIVYSAYRELLYGIYGAVSMRSDVLAWRNYVVAPLTEELVFRACMIPLLLCGGFKPYSIVFLCPLFFSLAHLNHFWELYYQKNYGICRAAASVGLQLGYTVIFGWYASFLFIRTATTMAFLAGIAGFFLMLAPVTNPVLYNDNITSCKCWQGFCKFKSEL